MSTGPTFENYNFVNFSFCSENEYPITAFSHHIRHQKSNVDSLLADNFFCLYTTHNFTAVTLVGFGRRPDTAECGHRQISNSSVATVAILPVGFYILKHLISETIHSKPWKLNLEFYSEAVKPYDKPANYLQNLTVSVFQSQRWLCQEDPILQMCCSSWPRAEDLLVQHLSRWTYWLLFVSLLLGSPSTGSRKLRIYTLFSLRCMKVGLLMPRPSPGFATGFRCLALSACSGCVGFSLLHSLFLLLIYDIYVWSLLAFEQYFFQKLIELLDLFTLYLLLWSNLAVNILLANQVDGQFTLPTWRADSLENFRVMKRYENKEQKLWKWTLDNFPVL